MNEFEKYTPTELLKIINDLDAEHKKLKKAIITNADKIIELQDNVNDDLKTLAIIEELYVKISTELTERK